MTLHTCPDPAPPPWPSLPCSELGFLVNAYGGETEIDAASFSYSGYAKRSLRQPIEKARKVRGGRSLEDVWRWGGEGAKM